jgi:hypothetical protein
MTLASPPPQFPHAYVELVDKGHMIAETLAQWDREFTALLDAANLTHPTDFQQERLSYLAACFEVYQRYLTQPLPGRREIGLLRADWVLEGAIEERDHMTAYCRNGPDETILSMRDDANRAVRRARARRKRVIAEASDGRMAALTPK